MIQGNGKNKVLFIVHNLGFCNRGLIGQHAVEHGIIEGKKYRFAVRNIVCSSGFLHQHDCIKLAKPLLLLQKLPDFLHRLRLRRLQGCTHHVKHGEIIFRYAVKIGGNPSGNLLKICPALFSYGLMQVPVIQKTKSTR